MRPVFVLSAARTPIGKFGGAFASLTAADLGEAAAKAALERSGLPPAAVDETIFGHARQAGGGPNTARQVSHRAGVPDSVPAFTVNKACASSLKAITLGALTIAAGENDVVLAGGTECMSATPYLLPRARFGMRMGDAEVVDAMYRDGFLCPLCGQLMGETAENLVREYGILRAEQDAYAARVAAPRGRRVERGPLRRRDRSGLRRRQEGQRDGRRPTSIRARTPVSNPSASFRRSSIRRAPSTPATPPASPTARRPSSSGPRRRRRRPASSRSPAWPRGPRRAWIRRGWASARCRRSARSSRRRSWRFRTSTSSSSTRPSPRRSSPARGTSRSIPTRLNVNGGAIALGHPIGATGARIATTLLHELRRRGAKRGIATLCVSGRHGDGGPLRAALTAAHKRAEPLQ